MAYSGVPLWTSRPKRNRIMLIERKGTSLLKACIARPATKLRTILYTKTHWNLVRFQSDPTLHVWKPWMSIESLLAADNCQPGCPESRRPCLWSQ